MTDLAAAVGALSAGRLPAGRLVSPEDGGEPVYWLSADPAPPGLWQHLRAEHPRTGLWPLLLESMPEQPDRPWEAGEVYPEDQDDDVHDDVHDAGALLAEWWPLSAADGDDDLAPYGRAWPGRAPRGEEPGDADDMADQFAAFLAGAGARDKLGLVLAPTGSDALRVCGWSGPANHATTTEIATVLRDWEDRFAARVVRVGFDTLEVSVAAEPRTLEEALPVAAEHVCFCSDIVWQGETPTLRSYARTLVGMNVWRFWWD